MVHCGQVIPAITNTNTTILPLVVFLMIPISSCSLLGITRVRNEINKSGYTVKQRGGGQGFFFQEEKSKKSLKGSFHLTWVFYESDDGDS